MLVGNLKGRLVRTTQQFCLALPSAMPERSYGMNNISAARRKPAVIKASLVGYGASF